MIQGHRDRYQAQLRLTRLRPSGRGADVWASCICSLPAERSSMTGSCANGEEVLIR